VNPNIKAWRDHQGQDIAGIIEIWATRYELTRADIATAKSADARKDMFIGLIQIAHELQQASTAALVDACHKAVANGLTLRSVGREAGVSDISIMRWINEINEFEPQHGSPTPSLPTGLDHRRDSCTQPHRAP
jgi:hypothetical protein